MEAKSLPAPSGPVTQEAAAARVLITYVNRLHGLPVPGSDEDLPEFYRLGSGLCLVRDSKKRNVYNVTRARRCSCPAGQKAGEPCGHSRIFFPAKRSKRRRWWLKMSSKAEVVRRVELIDQLSTVLRDLRRSEMEELGRSEAEKRPEASKEQSRI
jgi:hypothetical protein